MNTMSNLKSKGFISVPYPPQLKQSVIEAQRCWEAFCNLPAEAKRSFPYSNSSAGVGYEDKTVSGTSADRKENFDLSVGDRVWLEKQAETINNPIISAFIEAANKVARLITPSITALAHDIENEFGVEGFEKEVGEGSGSYFIRFIHYFPGATAGQEIAEAHTDQSGMTAHLFETAPGFECLSHDMKWEPVDVSNGEMLVIPSMQLQIRSEGQLKATVHRVVATNTTATTGRYSAVCFVRFERTPKYQKECGRLQDLHKNDLGFNYRMSNEEFRKMFK
jgi:isopenicillin N synthase-like dioxygenase